MTDLFQVIESIEDLERELTTGAAPEQYGPVRFRDNTMRCASRRCGSPTYIQVEGIPYCMMHAISYLNAKLAKLGHGPQPPEELEWNMERSKWE